MSSSGRLSAEMMMMNHMRYLVRSSGHHAIHLQFDISANALEIRVVQSPKGDIREGVYSLKCY
jgi:hypothetical protein